MRHVASVVTVLRNSLPWISFQTRVLIESMVLAGDTIGSCTSMAKGLGFHTRFAFTRSLRREGLPSFPRLSAWIRILIWTWNWEHAHLSLGPVAVGNGKDPAVFYRLVRRMTNRGWSTVRELGTTWVLQRLLEECADRGRETLKRVQKKERRGHPRRPDASGQRPYAHFGSPSLLAGASAVEPT